MLKNLNFEKNSDALLLIAYLCNVNENKSKSLTPATIDLLLTLTPSNYY